MSATGVRLLYDVLAVFVPGLWTPASYTGFFVLALATYVGLLVVGQTIYMGVLTDNIPRRRRGWIFGLRTLFNGVGGILTGLGSLLGAPPLGEPAELPRQLHDLRHPVDALVAVPLPRFATGRPAAARARTAGFLASLAGKTEASCWQTPTTGSSSSSTC